MKREFSGILQCPYDGFHPLDLISFVEEGGDIKHGILVCRKCNRWYPVQDFIVSIMPDGLRHSGEVALLERFSDKLPAPVRNSVNLLERNAATPAESRDSDKKSEIETRDAEAEGYLDMAQRLRGPAEVRSVISRLNPRREDIILDLGCGVGRLTCEVAPRCHRIVCADFSRESLRTLQKNCHARNIDNYVAVQCDATLLPFKDERFDRVLFADVLQHIPSEDLRRSAVQGTHRTLKESGVLLVEAYNYNIYRRLQRRVYRRSDTHPGNDGKTGYHSHNTVYYYNFSHRELRKLLGDHFRVEEIRGILIPLPFLRRLLGRGKTASSIDLILQKTPLSRWLGNLLLARCRKLASDTKVPNSEVSP